MILIADSGSTKTDWAFVPSDADSLEMSYRVFSTQGINPFHQSQDEISSILQEELVPQLPEGKETVTSVKFYGSGVRPEFEMPMVRLLRQSFLCAEDIEAHSDLLGTARSLCGCNEGIACILGTGANSCLYDGKIIVKNTSALGYILGDEGSGAVIGKHFLHALYMGLLSEEIKSQFEKQTGLSLASIIDRVYRQPMANRFLASLSTFIYDHLDNPDIRSLVVTSFTDFFRYHISPYNRHDLPVSFIGSIAWYYQKELCEASASQGFVVGQIQKSPMAGLLRYHRKTLS